MSDIVAVAALPVTGDSNQWNESEKALVEAAGLTVGNGPQKRFAPRPVVEAFLLHCRRTGLDPIARQIYCIERGGKWGTQVSIDGARLVAERTGQYRGQTPTQWTADGVTWTDVWLSEQSPAAARVGVRRAGFDEPLFAVATWKEYAIANGQMWKKMPALMLGKVAEMLALRKAFPQDLSGLYSTEEMAQANTGSASDASSSSTPPVTQIAVPQSDPLHMVELVDEWKDRAKAETTREGLTAVWQAAQAAGVPNPVLDAIRAIAAAFVQPSSGPEPMVPAPEPPAPRQWTREARLLTDRTAVQALWQEAKAAGVDPEVLDELGRIEASLAKPDEPEQTTGWATVEPGAGGWSEEKAETPTPEPVAAEDVPF